MAEKLFYSMGEVAEMFDVKPSLLRYWEEQFPALKPMRNKKGNRHYSPRDIELLKTLYHLIKERGMTLDGAKKALREERKTGLVARNAELMERLQRIRAMLEEVREDLKSDADELIDEEPVSTQTPALDKQGRAVLRLDEAAPSEEKPRVKRPRRKKNEEEKELFAFYEQSLF